MYILPEEKLELTDEIKNEILSLAGVNRSYDKIFKKYGKYFHVFSDIFEVSNFPVNEVIYILKNGRPLPCKYGKYPPFNKKLAKYKEYCGKAKTCLCKKYRVAEIQINAKKTNLERYGSEYPLGSSKVHEKRKKTMIERYGAENPSNISEFREKRKQTNLDRFGTESSLSSPEVIKKRFETNLKKYDSISPFGSKIVQEKSKKTVRDRYDVHHVMHIPEVKDKVSNTLLERYGVNYTLEIPCAREKLKNTVMTIYGSEWYYQSDDFKEKYKKTMLERHGVEYPMHSKKIVDKLNNTIMALYNSVWYYQSEDFKEKYKKTMMERYGVEHALKSPDIVNKVMESITRNSIKKHGTKSPMQKHYTDIGKQLLNDPELFQEYLDKYTVYELQEIFGCKSSTIYEYVKQFNLTIPIRTGSSYENILSEILTENGIDHVRQDRTIIPPKEIDIFIPSANLAIEINGLYWHSDKFKDKNYHYSKWKECHDNGIQLLSIMEDEFVNRSNTWISKILHICNKSKERIHARKCDIVELGKDGVYDFVEKYHLQGFSLAKHYYGAYYDNELVAMMSFTNTRNNKEIQMNRFCLKNGVVISGIANRLLKAYITDYDINEIVTYSDNRYSDGGIYRQMGFEMVNTIPPDYSYVKGMERLHKSGFKKSNIASKFGMDMSTKTEREAMEELGFVRIYDCGKVKWKFVKKSG